VQDSQDATKSAGVASVGSAVAIAAARNRATTIAPTAQHVQDELPGATCSAGRIVQGRVEVTLIGQLVGGATLASITTCGASTGSTIVTGVGTGIYSS